MPGEDTVAVVPAYDRADSVGETVRALLTQGGIEQVIVVDDGSRDATAARAADAGAVVVRLEENRGKGGAVGAGVDAAPSAGRYLLVDADLRASAANVGALIEPVAAGQAAMSIAVFPADGRSQGLGMVKRVAGEILRRATGRCFIEPLSGQRCVEGDLMRSLQLAPRFGLEVGLSLDVVGEGGEVVELPVELQHRATGRDLAGVVHRARQGRDLLMSAAARIGWRTVCRSVAAVLTGRAR